MGLQLVLYVWALQLLLFVIYIVKGIYLAVIGFVFRLAISFIVQLVMIECYNNIATVFQNFMKLSLLCLRVDHIRVLCFIFFSLYLHDCFVIGWRWKAVFWLVDCMCAGPAGGDGEAQGDVPVPGPDWPAAGIRTNQPGGCQPTAQVPVLYIEIRLLIEKGPLY
jgi:hypothetical protein